MPQLARGGKWVFGWVVVGPEGELPIPPEARDEYGFQSGEEIFFLPGSRTSGGFGLSTPRLLAQMVGVVQMPILAGDHFGKDGQIVVPKGLGIEPGERLLVVRGSGRALGFVARGPIYREATNHPELDSLRSPNLPG